MVKISPKMVFSENSHEVLHAPNFLGKFTRVELSGLPPDLIQDVLRTASIDIISLYDSWQCCFCFFRAHAQLVMCKGLSTLQGSGARVRRVRVRVRTFWPSTNPWPLSRVRGFSRVFQGFHFSYIKVQIEFKQCWIGENIIQRGLTTFATLSIVRNTLNSSYFINTLLKTMCTVINMLDWCVFQSYLHIYLLSLKLEQLFGPNPCPNPAGVSYPPKPWHTLTLTLQNPWPQPRVKGFEG